MSKHIRGLVMAAATMLVVAVVPSAVPERVGAAPAPALSSTAALPSASGQDASDNLIAPVGPKAEARTASDEGGSPMALLVVSAACLGVGLLALATRQPRPLSRRRPI